MFYLRKKRKELQMTWLGTAKVQLGLAHRTVRCDRPSSGEQATLRKVWRRTTIIHRTVRWCTRLSGQPTTASATVGRAIRERRVARAEPLAILPLLFVGFANMPSDPQIIDTDGPTSHRHGMA
jgi:hypothetical protein